MLISPIMSPITGMSFDITTVDSSLSSKSIKAIIFWCFISIVNEFTDKAKGKKDPLAL